MWRHLILFGWLIGQTENSIQSVLISFTFETLLAGDFAGAEGSKLLSWGAIKKAKECSRRGWGQSQGKLSSYDENKMKSTRSKAMLLGRPRQLFSLNSFLFNTVFQHASFLFNTVFHRCRCLTRSWPRQHEWLRSQRRSVKSRWFNEFKFNFIFIFICILYVLYLYLYILYWFILYSRFNEFTYRFIFIVFHFSGWCMTTM